jgi:hypothetical protein
VYSAGDAKMLGKGNAVIEDEGEPGWHGEFVATPRNHIRVILAGLLGLTKSIRR